MRSQSTTALLLAALGIRLWAGWAVGHFAHLAPWEYEDIANHVLAGEGYWYEHLGTAYRAFVLPVYPLFCAGVYRLTQHSQPLLLILQCLVSAFACLQVRSIGRLACSPSSVATVAAWLLALHPGLIFYASRLHPLTLDLFALLWMCASWLRLLRRPSAGHALQAGLSSGFAILSRGTTLVFFAYGAGWFLWHAARRGYQAVRRLATIGLVAGLIVAPWIARNTAHFHGLVLQTTSGELLWRGNNPVATGSAYLADGRPVLAGAPEPFRRRLAELDEAGQSRFFRQEAWAFIRTHPWQALRLYGQKWLAFWWFSPQAGLAYPRGYLYGYAAYYVPILLGACLGLYALGRTGCSAEMTLLLGALLTIAAVQSLYYVDGRHRWLVEPLLLLLSAVGWCALRRGAAIRS